MLLSFRRHAPCADNPGEFRVPAAGAAAPGSDDDGFRLVSRVPQTPEASPAQPKQETSTKTASPAATQRPTQPAAATRYPQGNKIDMMALDRAERIKAINNLLHNDANGAQLVESMKISELAGQEIDVVLHSAQTEASDSVIAPDGSVRPNASLFQLPD